MIHLYADLTGKDAVFISTSYRLQSGLEGLALYRNPPAPLYPNDKVKERIDYLQQAFEGGATGNRSQIALRKQARKEVTEMFKKIMRYLESVATEEDIPALLQAGFSIRKTGIRRRAVVSPA